MISTSVDVCKMSALFTGRVTRRVGSGQGDPSDPTRETRKPLDPTRPVKFEYLLTRSDSTHEMLKTSRPVKMPAKIAVSKIRGFSRVVIRPVGRAGRLSKSRGSSRRVDQEIIAISWVRRQKNARNHDNKTWHFRES